VQMSIRVDEPQWPYRASGTNIESSSSSRWRTDNSYVKQRHGVAALRQYYDQPHRALPDELRVLGASCGDVAGGELTFVSAERWGDIWLLHHHWNNPSAMHSPLGRVIEVVLDEATMVGEWIGGGTAPHGVSYGHVFAAGDLPERFIVRLPRGVAMPVFEVELSSV
jgi:hypothetical protein